MGVKFYFWQRFFGIFWQNYIRARQQRKSITFEVKPMGLTERREEIVKAMPTVETRIEKLPGKNLIAHKTIITDVKPIAYYNAVIEKSD